MCPLFRGSTVHKEEDNLSIVDKMAGPNVSFIQSVHCMYNCEVSIVCGCSLLFIILTGGSAPTLPEIISLSLPDGSILDLTQQIGTHFNRFGIMLLNDETGARITAIETQHSKNAQNINLEVFKSWINGEGREPISWNTLVTVLREIGLNPLADKINSTLN